MLKNKLFYLILAFFLSNTFCCYAQTTNLFDSAPITGEKSDAFWDLAWHARLADYGDKESQFIIAQAYEKGDNIQKNMKKAVAFYQKAAANGHIESMIQLAHLYETGNFVEQNAQKAFRYYESAAKQGYTPAQLKLSELYQRKQHLDFKMAYYWLATALKTMFPTQSELEKISPDLKKLAFQLTSEEYKQVQHDLR